MGYRVEHNITGSPAGNQTNYQMKITIVNGTGTSNESVYYTTHVNQSDFDDVRFTWYNTTSGQEEENDYWGEEVNSGSNATFWVEVPEVSSVTDNTIYIYYGSNNTTKHTSHKATKKYSPQTITQQPQTTKITNSTSPFSIIRLPVLQVHGCKTESQSTSYINFSTFF